MASLWPGQVGLSNAPWKYSEQGRHGACEELAGHGE